MQDATTQTDNTGQNALTPISDAVENSYWSRVGKLYNIKRPFTDEIREQLNALQASLPVNINPHLRATVEMLQSRIGQHDIANPT